MPELPSASSTGAAPETKTAVVLALDQDADHAVLGAVQGGVPALAAAEQAEQQERCQHR